jgi:hypothetical protein
MIHNARYLTCAFPEGRPEYSNIYALEPESVKKASYRRDSQYLFGAIFLCVYIFCELLTRNAILYEGHLQSSLSLSLKLSEKSSRRIPVED